MSAVALACVAEVGDDWFWRQVEVRGPDDCWPWLGRPTAHNYGQAVWPDGRREQAHRVAFRLAGGVLADVDTADHTCHDASCQEGERCPHRLCCNPGHARPASSRENTLRGNTLAAANLAKERCPQGHPYDEVNTYVNPQGARVCRTCQREHKRRYNAGKATGRRWAGKATLTVDDVRAIRASDEPYPVLAARYGVTPECARAVRTRRTWGWVT